MQQCFPELESQLQRPAVETNTAYGKQMACLLDPCAIHKTPRLS